MNREEVAPPTGPVWLGSLVLHRLILLTMSNFASVLLSFSNIRVLGREVSAEDAMVSNAEKAGAVNLIILTDRSPEKCRIANARQ